MRRSNVVVLAALVGGAASMDGCDGRPLAESWAGVAYTNSGDAGSDPLGDCDACTDGGVDPIAPQPTFGTTVTAAVPPPPISGGTLLVTHDGHTVVAADSDRDAVYVVDATAAKVLFTVPLQSGDEPGRVTEDGAGRVHVALRGGGALATIDPTTGALLARRAVCPAPRGAAWDATRDVVWVACATGDLVALPSAGGAATTTYQVERDLRDVVVQDGALSVTTFRQATVLRIASDGTVSRRDAVTPFNPESASHVAWRAVAGPGGGLLLSNQEHTRSSLSTVVPGGYGAGGTPAVESVVTTMSADGASTSLPVPFAVLPVDVALSANGKSFALVAPGNAFTPLGSLLLGQLDDPGSVVAQAVGQSWQLVAVAFDGAGDVVVQGREPAMLYVAGTDGTVKANIALAKATRADTGHDIFHTQAGGLLACASCHPEGGDDGHVWTLDGESRRTPSLRGTIAGTAPYHWPGDEVDFATLAGDVYTRRMSGAALSGSRTDALRSWVEHVPPPPAPSWVDAAAAQRGRALFARADVGCSTCHSGDKLTNNATVDVGTGGSFQVPPLVGVGWRTPLLHDGCAATLLERLTTCGSPQHGSTSGLSAADLNDLVAYLETL